MEYDEQSSVLQIYNMTNLRPLYALFYWSPIFSHHRENQARIHRLCHENQNHGGVLDEKQIC